MIDEWRVLVAASERKGWEDGLACAPYEPILQWGMSRDADDVYTSAYFHGLAYGRAA